MRTPLVAANWKMNKTIDEAVQFVSGFAAEALQLGSSGESWPEVLVCPPYTSIPALAALFAGKAVALGGQNMYFAEKGAFTGEVSPLMLKDLGCKYVILGHSERRQLFGETNDLISKKVRSALDHGLRPIMCLGETFEEREAGKTLEVCREMLLEGLRLVKTDEGHAVTLAYEPVWAIGTGKEAEPEDAAEVAAFLRERMEEKFGQEFAESVRILYGGSVKSSNIRPFMMHKDIDGALVGGASLDPVEFAKIVREVAKARPRPDLA